MFSLTRYCQTVCQSACPSVPSRHERVGECTLIYSINNTCSCLSHLSYSCKHERVFTLVLIGISVKTYKVKHLFLYWLDIWISPFVKCLFMSFAPFFYCVIWCFPFIPMILYCLQMLLICFFCKYLLRFCSLSFHWLSDVFSLPDILIF